MNTSLGFADTIHLFSWSSIPFHVTQKACPASGPLKKTHSGEDMLSSEVNPQKRPDIMLRILIQERRSEIWIGLPLCRCPQPVLSYRQEKGECGGCWYFYRLQPGTKAVEEQLLLLRPAPRQEALSYRLYTDHPRDGCRRQDTGHRLW